MKPSSPVLLDAPAIRDREIVLGEGQPQYVPLPALCQQVTVKDGVMSGPFVDDIRQANYVVTRWELTDEEIERLRETKSIYLSSWKTVGDFFNPLALSTQQPIEAKDITFTPIERVIAADAPVQETESNSN